MIKRKDNSEQRAIIAILLSLALYWVWQATFLPPQAAVAPPEAAPVAAPANPVATTAAAASGADPSAGPAAAIPVADLPLKESPFAYADVEATMSTDGGSLVNVILSSARAPFDVTPLWMYAYEVVTGASEGSWSPYGEEPGPATLVTSVGVLIAAGAGDLLEGRYAQTGQDPPQMERTLPSGLKVTKTYRLGDDPNFLEVEVRFENAGSGNWSGPLWVGSYDHFEGDFSRYSSVSRPMALVDGDLVTQEDLSDLDEAPEVEEGPVGWFGLGDRYFMAAAIPENPTWGRATFARPGNPDAAGVFMVRDQSLAPGQMELVKLRVYIGAKDLQLLRTIPGDLDQSVDFGFFGFFSEILLFILQKFQSLVGNWGVAIILLTITVKGAFWPLTRKSFTSSRAMQTIQPQVQVLRDKYQDDPQKLGQEQMKLFKEAGVNPLSGCLPMVVQMPVWFALYSVLLFSADVYHAQFLYLRDLSSTDPIGVLPFIVGVLMVLQQRLTPMSPSMDPAQQKIMRLMPLMFVGFMFVFPSGLCLYILVNTLLSITQMWLINRANPIPAPS